MATTNGKAFVDTNILLRATIEGFPLYEEAKQLIYNQREIGTELWVSRQVIREYIAQATRPQSFAKPLPMERVDHQIRIISRLFMVADETAQVTNKLLELLKEIPSGGKQIHDVNIIATMLTFGISSLLTQNIEDMRRFAGKITIVPLNQIL